MCLQRRKVTRTKIEILDASLDRQPKIQSSSVEETLQIIMGQANNDCRFPDLHFEKFPTPATFACWKIRFKTEVFIFFHNFVRKRCNGSKCRILKYLMRGMLQH